MYEIVKKEALNPTVMRMDIKAPLIAKKALAGQFVIVRADERGERIPLTVAGCDAQTGAVTIIFQIVGGATIYRLAQAFADRLYISYILGHYEGDTYLKEIDFSRFRLTWQKQTEQVRYTIYERVVE